ncbi:hypothetical protein LIA77_11445 [Sarocladium implicatum]|nr:hypothetical protein LIA77_11445 [Sarocladium implicatum]
MRLKTVGHVFACLAATVAAEEGIAFDWPDPSQKLNLSAPLSLDYTYSRDEVFDGLTQLDLSFYYHLNHTDWVTWWQDIAMNLTLTGGRGTIRWDPSELLDSIESDGFFMAPGHVHHFEVKRHEANGFGMGVESPSYAVEATRGVDNAAMARGPVCGVFLMGLCVAMLVV